MEAPHQQLTSQSYFHLKSKKIFSTETMQKRIILKSYHLEENTFKYCEFLKFFAKSH